VEQKPPKKKRIFFLVIMIAILGLAFYFFFMEDGRIKRPGFDSRKLVQTQKKAEVTLNQYLELYAGTYEIKLKDYSGTDTEIYHLYATGEANCEWSFGARSTIRYGTWTASNKTIILTIKDSTGDIIETFVREGEHFTRTNNSNRYLVKQ
jgi:hypothetical protein